MKMEQSVPKRRHIKFRRRGITQKKPYNFRISMFHRAFFNSIIDEYQHMHFFTFNTVLVYRVDFIKIHKNI